DLDGVTGDDRDGRGDHREDGEASSRHHPEARTRLPSALMVRVLLVGLAGALGTLLRYVVGVWAGKALGTGFPYGTLIVNVAGCFFIALVSQLALSTTSISPTTRLALTTGFMGGLTTYSSFNYETTSLLRERAWLAGFANLGITLLLCFAAGLLGLLTARRLTGG
ncbi:MAG: fluoride efflux transporter FluC, partial [Polyangiaceae bacterium]